MNLFPYDGYIAMRTMYTCPGLSVFLVAYIPVYLTGSWYATPQLLQLYVCSVPLLALLAYHSACLHVVR